MELADKASTTNRKRLIAQDVRHALYSLSTGVFACFTSGTTLFILSKTYDGLQPETTSKQPIQSSLAGVDGETQPAAWGSETQATADLPAYAENAAAPVLFLVSDIAWVLYLKTELVNLKAA